MLPPAAHLPPTCRTAATHLPPTRCPLRHTCLPPAARLPPSCQLFTMPDCCFNSCRLIPGTLGVGHKTELYGVPYSLSEDFVSSYRLHPLIPDEFTLGSDTVKATDMLFGRQAQCPRQCATPSLWCCPAHAQCGTYTIATQCMLTAAQYLHSACSCSPLLTCAARSSTLGADTCCWCRAWALLLTDS